MMKKRNAQVFILDNIPYLPEAPVVITGGCLQKDGVSGKLRCQMDMASLSDKPVSEVTVLLTLMGADGEAVAPIQRQRFSNLSVRKDGTIKGKTEVVLSQKDVNSFTAETEKVIFEDGSAWAAKKDAEWFLLPRMQTLEEAYGDEEMAEQFRIRFGEDCRYLPWSDGNLWYCTCGAVNRGSDNRCRNCRRVQKGLMRVNREELRKETNKRQNREQKLEEETAVGKKKRIAAWAAIPAALIVMAAIAFVLFGSGKLLQRTEKTAEPPATEEPAETPEAAITPEVTVRPDAAEEPKEDPAEAEKNRTYEQAMLLLERADAGDASALSEIGKSQENVAEGETAAMLLYRAALDVFEGLDGYLDSGACAARCRDGIAAQEQLLKQLAYDAAAALLEDRHYSEACRQFEALGEYGNSKEMAKEAIYRKAVGLCDVIRDNNVRGIYAAVSMNPDTGSRFVMVGDLAPATDSSCAQGLLAACGSDPAEMIRADVEEEGMLPLTETVTEMFRSLSGYRDSDACILAIQEATDYTGDFYRLCAEGDLAGAQEWLNNWGDEIEERELWQSRLERFTPYCGSWAVYSGDMSIIPWIVSREGMCYEFHTRVTLEDDNAVLHLSARDGEEEYGVDFTYEMNKEYFYNSDYPPYSYLMVINSTGRMSTLMYNTNTGGLMTSCEYKRAYNG